MKNLRKCDKDQCKPHGSGKICKTRNISLWRKIFLMRSDVKMTHPRTSSLGRLTLLILVVLCVGMQKEVGRKKIEMCQEQYDQLENDVKLWKGRCVNQNGTYNNSIRCNEEKEYNKERMKSYTEICFYNYGTYPGTYLFLLTKTTIDSIDLLTKHVSKGVISGLTTSNTMDIDIVDRKVYFSDKDDIKRANFYGTNVEMFVKNAKAKDMTIDWICRRLLYVDGGEIIYMIDLYDKNAVEFKTKSYLNGIAMDPIKGIVNVVSYRRCNKRIVCIWTISDKNPFSSMFTADVRDVFFDVENEKLYYIIPNGLLSRSYVNNQSTWNTMDYTATKMVANAKFLYLLEDANDFIHVHDGSSIRTKEAFDIPKATYLDIALMNSNTQEITSRGRQGNCCVLNNETRFVLDEVQCTVAGLEPSKAKSYSIMILRKR
ncbi:uncharacterized protein LOC124439020 [Xenia sp. Carnegie-2017]|uniref:uncharacterized protein LOC124439020 n=1 Tax=Xenia sp. Carnegie-2017 TaxID=2897299 RepID=UPI001F03D517|nr:uncharacterized protein LOC124439020 [Xenia sp. Carnegie-2017]